MNQDTTLVSKVYDFLGRFIIDKKKHNLPDDFYYMPNDRSILTPAQTRDYQALCSRYYTNQIRIYAKKYTDMVGFWVIGGMLAFSIGSAGVHFVWEHVKASHAQSVALDKQMKEAKDRAGKVDLAFDDLVAAKKAMPAGVNEFDGNNPLAKSYQGKKQAFDAANDMFGMSLNSVVRNAMQAKDAGRIDDMEDIVKDMQKHMKPNMQYAPAGLDYMVNRTITYLDKRKELIKSGKLDKINEIPNN